MGRIHTKNCSSLEKNFGRYEYSVFLREQGEDNSPRRRELRDALRDAMGTVLTRRQRQYMELYYFQGLNCVEIASLLFRCPSAVSRCLRRGKARLMAHFSPPSDPSPDA